VAIKANGNTLQCIITAYNAGRRVDLPQILSHELMAVPLAISDANNQLRTVNKLVMMELLSSGTEGPWGHTNRKEINTGSRWSSTGNGIRKTRLQHIRRSLV